MDQNPAADLWRNTLSRIPTVFSRLHYLASLRDPHTGEYHHFGLAQRFGDADAESAIRESHLQVFGDWLALNLERQKLDLEQYLDGLEGDKKTIIGNWIRLNSLRTCIPRETREVERELYLGDLQTILDLLKYEYAVVLPDPNA